MEIALINRQDVAEPDQVSSGVAGTGQKNGKNTGIVEHEMERDAVNRIVLGMGVLHNGRTTPSAPGAVPASCPGPGVICYRTKALKDPSPDPCKRSKNSFFSGSERQERSYEWLNRKITRLGQRLNTLKRRRMHTLDERRESE